MKEGIHVVPESTLALRQRKVVVLDLDAMDPVGSSSSLSCLRVQKTWGGAIAGAPGGLTAVPAASVHAVTEGSGTDVFAPVDLMVDVAAEAFDRDRRWFEAHRMVVDRLVR